MGVIENNVERLNIIFDAREKHNRLLDIYVNGWNIGGQQIMPTQEQKDQMKAAGNQLLQKIKDKADELELYP